MLHRRLVSPSRDGGTVTGIVCRICCCARRAQRSRGTGQSAFDHREDLVERHPAAAVYFLIEKLRLLVIDGRCRQRDVVRAVGKLRDLGEEVFDGLSDGRAGHLPSPSAVVALPHGLFRSLVVEVDWVHRRRR
jgi:hypothetical protein